MNHRGVSFTIQKTNSRNVWAWSYKIDDQTRTGRTHTTLELLAIHRVQILIDRELRQRQKPPAQRS
ncbi:hypothetical protein XH90_14765 [Bradyrhizobium sp. CCBAU 53338]|nr:hypothetical protein [Bradyrhizobium sp. CCBAU 53338]QOZ52492.1 hypothetical protein XH90_14765 [Bradyrhizobium sp. CCBAU 53338]